MAFRPTTRPPPSAPEGPGSTSGRQHGIALLVVMVVFVVLYLVVYQLHFSSSMEEKIAQVRFGQVESAVALQSAALYTMTLLVEDLKQSLTQGAGSGGTGDSLDGLGGAGADRGVGVDRGAAAAAAQGGAARAAGAAGDEAGGRFAPIVAGGAGGSRWYDHIHQNKFLENRQSVGETTVKITIVDGERAFDLNHLFDYVRLEGETVEGGLQDLREEDLVNATEGLTGREDEATAANTLLQRIQLRRESKAKEKQAKAGPGGAAGGAETEAGAEEAALRSDYEEEEFVEPEPERLQKTIEMMERAIRMMFSINENLGFTFPSGMKYSSLDLASNIVHYILERRRQPYQNRIYLVSELLNVPGVTAELYYGPFPQLAAGEDFAPLDPRFVLKRDEFGDVVPEYQDPTYALEREEQKLMLEELKNQYQDFGRFIDLPGVGLGRLESNALTRGMTELPIDVDEEGAEYVVEQPVPMGLKDLFTTFSTGKININTASPPVLYALLLSLDDAPGGDAENVAFDIRDYRNQFQEEVDEAGVARVGDEQTPDLGQPRRPRRNEEAAGAAPGAAASAAEGAGAIPGLDASGLGDLESTYQDTETNYFTSLEQLELVDGVDGGPQDRLNRQSGVARVSAEDNSLLRRAINDLEKVAVFGSTYFTAELKGKSKQGRSVSAGQLTLRRDLTKKMMEVILWKNIQK